MEEKSLDINKLFLDDSKLDRNFYGYDTESHLIEKFTHNDLINDYLIERVRRLNISANYLVVSLQRFQYNALCLTQKHDEFDEKDYYAFLNNYRCSCRDVLINIDIFIENIKTFIRYYFFMDLDKTDDTKIWMKTLKNYDKIPQWKYIQVFLDKCSLLYVHEDTKLLNNIRNKEVHSTSPIQLMKYKFLVGNLIPVPVEYIISNQELHDKILNVVELLLDVVAALQDLLNNISPKNILNYLSPQDGKLKNIIKMSNRYKKEKEFLEEIYK